MINLSYIKYQPNWSKRTDFFLFGKKNIYGIYTNASYKKIYFEGYVGEVICNNSRLTEYYDEMKEST